MCNMSGTCDTWVVVCRGVCYVTCIRHIGDCLQVTWDSMVVICWGVLLSLIWGRLAGVCRERVLCSLLEADWRLSVGGVLYYLHEADWRLSGCGGEYSVIYMRQGDDGLLGVLCQLHEASWRLSAGGGVVSVRYLRQISKCLQGMCALPVT